MVAKQRSSQKMKTPSFDPLTRGAKPGINHVALFRERVLAIKPETVVAVLHDTDSDGICSAVLVAKAIDRLRQKPIDHFVNQQHKEVGLTTGTIEYLKKKRVDVLFVTDKAIDQNPETAKQGSLFFKIIVFDHHQVEQDLSDEMILIIKSQFISHLDGATYPTSKLVYDLFNPLIDLSDLDWVCAAGVIADASYPTWKVFIDAIMKRYNIKKTKDIFESQLGLISRYIGSTILYDHRKVKEVLDILMKSNGPDELLESNLKDYEKAVDDEIQYWIKKHFAHAQFFPELELIVYIVSPRFPINSPLSTILSKKYYPQQTLIVIHDSGDSNLGISLRRQDYKVHCPNLVKGAISGLLNSNGGGHIPAAGGKILRKDLDTFLENLKQELRSGNHRLPGTNTPTKRLHLTTKKIDQVLKKKPIAPILSTPAKRSKN